VPFGVACSLILCGYFNCTNVFRGLVWLLLDTADVVSSIVSHVVCGGLSHCVFTSKIDSTAVQCTMYR